MAGEAPRFKTDRSSDEAILLSNPGVVNLRTVAGRPAFSPQRLTVRATAAAGAITVTPDVGPNLVLTALAAGIPVSIDTPIRAIVSSATVEVTCEWWTAPGSSTEFNYGPYTRNAP